MRLEFPFLWFTQPIKANPRPWRFFKIDGLMVNAYEILHNDSVVERVRKEGVHKYMEFDGLIAIDSGGYLFMKRGEIDVTPEVILTLYEESKPNFGVVLDFPSTPNLPREVVEERLSKTLENTRRMLELRRTTNPVLIPVIHGHEEETIKRYVKRLQEIGDFDIYGIGSLVPSVFNTKGVGGIHNVVRVISLVRTLLPDKIIHVFGVGSAITMHLMFYAGVDSIDTTSWRTKAAFGAIQLPGSGDRYITPRKRHKHYRGLSEEERRILDECKCPACKKEGLEGLVRSFKLRALHNAWVYQGEVERARKLMRNGEYGEYVKDLIRKNRTYMKVLELIESLQERNRFSDELSSRRNI
jgi:tRNA-guanine family transglycosylase